MKLRQPTVDECHRNVPIDLPDGRRGFAVIYPQVGGYVTCAIAVPTPTSSSTGVTDAPEDWCFDVYLFTDGEFPHAKDVEGGFGWSREEINRSEQSVAEMVAHAAERLENKLSQRGFSLGKAIRRP